MGAFESGPTAAERLAVATELVDTWNEGWENYDAEVVTSVFAEDGVYVTEDAVVPKELIKYEVWSTPLLSNVDRVGGLTLSGDDTYTWVGEFVVNQNGNRFGGNWEIELEGDLAKRIELDALEERPASDSSARRLVTPSTVG